MKIKLYAPVDCEVRRIEKSQDAAFASKLLGDGLVIIPKKEIFKSPFESAEVELIFNTKHAYGFKLKNDIKLLMHIGIDTVNLNGEGFSTNLKVGQQIDLSSKVVKVDLNLLKERKILSETPMVFDLSNVENFEILDLVEGNYKQGEVIGEFEIGLLGSSSKENVSKLPTDEKIKMIIENKNILQLNTEKIYRNVGGQKNYNKLISCFTRLRFSIIDKDKVNIDEIKKIPIVQNVIWFEDQLQVVIGTNVSMYLEEIKKIESLENSISNHVEKKNQPTSKKFMSAVTGIIIPTFPVLFASGILMGIKTILVMTGVIVDMGIGSANVNTNVDLFSLFVNIASDSGLKLLGIFMGYTAVKYFKGPVIIQLYLSVAIAGATLGLGIPQWELFSIGGLSINIGMYTSSILPHIISAILITYAYKRIKTWIPSSLEMMFAPAISFLIVYALILFVFGPTSALLENGLAWLILQVSKIPYGFGVAIFAALWQPLVITGMHPPVATVLQVPIFGGQFSTIYFGMQISIFGQLGAALGVAIMTKNLKTKVLVLAATPGAFVAVSEPILYGINIPKMKPFIAGIASSFIMGLLSGMMAVELRTFGGLGIFGFVRASQPPRLENVIENGVTLFASAKNIFTQTPNSIITNTVLWFVTNLGAIPLGILISVGIFSERPKEIKSFRRVGVKLLKRLSSVKLANLKSDYKEEVLSLTNEFSKDDLLAIKELEKLVIKKISLEVRYNSVLNKIDSNKKSISKKLKSICKKPNCSNKVIEKLISQFENVDKKFKISEIEKDLKEINLLVNKKYEEVGSIQERIYNNVEKIISSTGESLNNIVKNNFKIEYWNALHSVDINYELAKARNKEKEERKTLKWTKK